MEKPDDEDAVSSFSGTDGLHCIESWNRKYRRRIVCNLYRRIWSSILDVGDRNYWKRICVRGEYTGTDL